MNEKEKTSMTRLLELGDLLGYLKTDLEQREELGRYGIRWKINRLQIIGEMVEILGKELEEEKKGGE